MVEEMVKNVLEKQLDSKYPHLLLPMAMCAKIVTAAPMGDKYKYSIKIVDKNGDTDDQFPEIPGVYSKLSFEVDQMVAILLLYGELNPYIVGEVL